MTFAQFEGAPQQVHPVSGAQAAEQPSLAAVFPSSHCSVPPIVPSPHTVAHAVPPPLGHEYPAAQSELVVQLVAHALPLQPR